MQRLWSNTAWSRRHLLTQQHHINTFWLVYLVQPTWKLPYKNSEKFLFHCWLQSSDMAHLPLQTSQLQQTAYLAVCLQPPVRITQLTIWMSPRPKHGHPICAMPIQSVCEWTRSSSSESIPHKSQCTVFAMLWELGGFCFVKLQSRCLFPAIGFQSSLVMRLCRDAMRSRIVQAEEGKNKTMPVSAAQTQQMSSWICFYFSNHPESR